MLDMILTNHCSDDELVALARHRRQRRDVVEIDQVREPCQAERQQRHQALTTGERLCFLSVFGEHGSGLVDRIIEHHDLLAPLQAMPGDMRADKSGAAGHQYVQLFHLNVFVFLDSGRAKDLGDPWSDDLRGILSFDGLTAGDADLSPQFG